MNILSKYRATGGSYFLFLLNFYHMVQANNEIKSGRAVTVENLKHGGC